MKKKSLLKSFILTSVLLVGAKSAYAVEPPPNLPAAPEHPAENVFSIYSDTYAANPIATFTFTGTDAEEVDASSGDYLKYVKIGGNGTTVNYGSAALTFDSPIDIAEYDVIYFDIYNVDIAFDLKLTFNNETSSFANVGKIQQGWNKVELELNDYRILAAVPDFTQVEKINITTGYGGRTVYIDNIYACKTIPKDLIFAPVTPAPTPRHEQENVLAVFSDFYEDEIGIQINSTTPGDVKKFKGLKFPLSENLDKMYYVEKGMNSGDGGLNFPTAVDVSEYDSIHMDLYLVDATSLPIRFRFGIGTGSIAPNPATALKTAVTGWNSIDLNLQDFVALSAGYDLTTMNGFGFWHRTGGKRSVFVDNIYFYRERTTVGIENSLSCNSEINIYPSRVNDKIYVKSENTISEVKIVNLLGAVIDVVKTNSEEVEISADNLNKGIYIIQVAAADKQVVTKKIIKM